MIVAGMGFTSKASRQSLLNAIEQTGYMEKITAISTRSDKAEEAVFKTLAKDFNLKIISLPDEVLKQIETPGFSARAHTLTGIGCVCEACALAAAGNGARLVAEKHISIDGQATAAIALGKKS